MFLMFSVSPIKSSTIVHHFSFFFSCFFFLNLFCAKRFFYLHINLEPKIRIQLKGLRSYRHVCPSPFVIAPDDLQLLLAILACGIGHFHMTHASSRLAVQISAPGTAQKRIRGCFVSHFEFIFFSTKMFVSYFCLSICLFLRDLFQNLLIVFGAFFKKSFRSGWVVWLDRVMGSLLEQTSN